jgi:hypothetical protein
MMLEIDWESVYDGIYNRIDNKTSYRYTCNRCGSEMPKAIKAFIKLKALQEKVGADV